MRTNISVLSLQKQTVVRNELWGQALQKSELALGASFSAKERIAASWPSSSLLIPVREKSFWDNVFFPGWYSGFTRTLP